MLYPDAVETLRRLRPLKLGIVTNGSETSQAAKVVNSGLDRLVDTVVISGVVGVAKPDSGIFDVVCARLGVSPTHCVMVGDSPEHDVGGGKLAGMRTVWVARGPWPEGRRAGLQRGRAASGGSGGGGSGVGMTPPMVEHPTHLGSVGSLEFSRRTRCPRSAALPA